MVVGTSLTAASGFYSSCWPLSEFTCRCQLRKTLTLLINYFLKWRPSSQCKGSFISDNLPSRQTFTSMVQYYTLTTSHFLLWFSQYLQTESVFWQFGFEKYNISCFRVVGFFWTVFPWHSPNILFFLSFMVEKLLEDTPADWFCSTSLQRKQDTFLKPRNVL